MRKKVVIVVVGEGCPQCVVVDWLHAREALLKLFYGSSLHPKDVQDESRRWALFSNMERWSIDQDSAPFEYEGENFGDGSLRAFFINVEGQ